MDLNRDFIIKALGVATLGVVIAKIGATYLFNFFDKLSGNYKNEKHDIDALIEAKKQIIRSGAYGQLDETPPPLPTEAIIQKHEHEIKSLLTQPETSVSQKENLKKILKYYEEAIWGGGTNFENLKNEFKNKTGLALDTSVFVKSFRLADARLIFNKQYDLKKIESLILNYTFMQKLMSESLEGQGTLIRLLAEKNRLPQGIIIKSIESLFLADQFKNEHEKYNHFLQYSSTTELLKTNKEKREHILEKIISKYSLENFELKLREEAILYASLLPLPELKNDNDVNTAYQILGVHPKTKLEDIKKVYHQLSLERHPDRFIGKKISTKNLSIASRNFQLLKASYDLILRQRKEHA